PGFVLGCLSLDCCTGLRCITELPVRRWTREYKEFLKVALQGGEHKTPFIKAYTTHNDHTIEIMMTEDQMTTARQEGLVKKFKLTIKLSTSDMHLFDAKGVLKKYDTIEQILTEFFYLRLEFYAKRRIHIKWYQSQVSILGPVGYGPTMLLLRRTKTILETLLYANLATNHGTTTTRIGKINGDNNGNEHQNLGIREPGPCRSDERQRRTKTILETVLPPVQWRRPSRLGLLGGAIP
nr:DNA topoisomerase 2 isoform X2 [Tanacetum cinerariifolium]